MISLVNFSQAQIFVKIRQVALVIFRGLATNGLYKSDTFRA
jgi:hypothetical protein